MRSKTAFFILALSAGLLSGGGLLAPALAQTAGQAQPTTAHGLSIAVPTDATAPH